MTLSLPTHMISLFAGAAFLAGCASVATASGETDPRIVTVETATAVPAAKDVIAQRAVWDCEGNTCSARLLQKNVSVLACTKLVREIGPVTSYSNGFGSLSAAELAECNGGTTVLTADSE